MRCESPVLMCGGVGGVYEATSMVQELVDGLKEAVGLEVGEVYKEMIATHYRSQVHSKISYLQTV